jgi:phasin
MSETTETAEATARPDAFDTPKFEIPNFPKIDMPAAYREFSERSIATAKETYQKLKAAAEESTAMLEDTYASATKGVTAYNLKLLDCARANSNAAFDFAGSMMSVKSFAEAIELSSAHLRGQFEALTTQGRELTELAQKTAGDVAEPLKTGAASAFRKVA